MPTLLLKMACSRAQIYILIHEQHFPAPLHLGGRGSWWDCAEVEAWLEASKAAERKAA
jgi:predicted DNA-binding transcriptional regulator AlpA